MKKRMILVAALSAIAMLLPAAGASAGGAVVIPFTKQVFAAGDTTIWTGFAGAGTIYTTLPAEGVRPSGSVWHTNFGMQNLAESQTGCNSFSADLAGIVNLANGRVSLNGTVTKGDCIGSRIHVVAILDLTDFSSEGTMRITP